VNGAAGMRSLARLMCAIGAVILAAGALFVPGYQDSFLAIAVLLLAIAALL